MAPRKSRKAASELTASLSGAVLFFILNLVDANLTILNLKVGSVEIMPVAAWIVNTFGTNALLVAKIVLPIVVISTLMLLKKTHLFGLLNLLMAFVVFIISCSLIFTFSFIM